jgi:hypothetical protein
VRKVEAKDDFIVTVHALERMAERFPALIEGMDDTEVAEWLHREVMENWASGRRSSVAPAEFAPHRPRGWVPSPPGGSIVWNLDKSRGYALQEEPSEGLLVLTVLVGTGRQGVPVPA